MAERTMLTGLGLICGLVPICAVALVPIGDLAHPEELAAHHGGAPTN